MYFREFAADRVYMMSITGKIKSLYNRFIPLPDYYGDDFKKIYTFLLASQTWDKDKINAYKLDQLKALITHAEENVPYYQELFKKHGITSRDINSFEDFRKIPILTKSMLRENLERLKALNYKDYHPFWTQTSGTTSSMTALYRSSYHEAFRKAAVWRFFRNFGYDFRQKRVSLSCRSFDRDSVLADHDRIENNLIINTYHIIDGHHKEAAEALINFRPNLIWAHPTPLSILGEYILENNLGPVKVPIIAHYSEVMYPHVRKILEQAFESKFIEYYGNRENTIGAWGQSDGIFYEISEYCHLEIENAVDPKNPRQGDIISTSLHNYAVPLIRYHTEDLGIALDYHDPELPYPAFQLLGGRGKDLLLASEGLTVPYFLAYIDKMKFNKLRKYQMEQVSLDEVILRVVPNEHYDKSNDEQLLLKYAEESTANKFRFRLEYVDDIPLTENGKYRSVISQLAVDSVS